MTVRNLAIIAALVAIIGGFGLSRLGSVVTGIKANLASPPPPKTSSASRDGHPYGLANSLPQGPGSKAILELDPPPPEIRFHPEEVRRFADIKTLFNRGDYQQALDTIYAQLADDRSTIPYKAILTKKIPIVTSAIAIQLANNGGCSGAVEIFQNAITRDPEQGEAHRGLIQCFIQLKLIEDGVRHVEAYKLTHRPGYQLTEGISLLFEQAGRSADAIFLIKKLIRHLLSQKNPDFARIQRLRGRLTVLQSRLSERQLQVSDGNAHFAMTYREGDHEEMARRLLESGEPILDEFNRDYALPYPSKPIETVLYPKEEFNKLVGGGPSWAKGVFDGRIRLPIGTADENDRLLSIFRHELVHALLWQAFKGKPIPGWFNEGLAQLLECPKGCAPRFRSMARQPFLPAEAFLVSFAHLPAAKARTVYIQSLFMVTTLAVESLGFGPSVYPIIIQHVSDLRQTVTSEAAMSDLLLGPVDLSFRQLHRLSARRWQQLSATKPRFGPGEE